MSDNARASTQQPAALFLRDNLVVLAHCGDQAIEIPLEPTQALEFAAALITTALEVARHNAAARTGALQAISEAQHGPVVAP
jgi:hypothetical protein